MIEHSARQTIFYIFGPLALAGLLLSVATHVAALTGRSGPLGDFSMVLHVGIFVVWIPAVFLAKDLARGSKSADLWKQTLRGAPAWVRYANQALFIYTAVNFFIFIGLADKNTPGGGMSAADVRGFSGHWMLFYATALSILYSASNIPDRERTCPHGHPIGPRAGICLTCLRPPDGV
ncbi:MAG TPA: hypothetical protein VGQ36_29215 [Thermoanaerobaculia bacterium]|jgi:hypothetical protein|nr:hypothetical protein [Thermoanaerobaculia bacterium]